MFDILKVKKELKMMEKHLISKSDEKLIRGYKDAMRDSLTPGNEQSAVVAEIIKVEIDRRCLKL